MQESQAATALPSFPVPVLMNLNFLSLKSIGPTHICWELVRLHDLAFPCINDLQRTSQM